MKNKEKFFLITAIIVIIAIGVFIFVSPFDKKDDETYNYYQFENDLTGNNIKEITIDQSSDIPTGTVKIVLNDNSEKELYVENISSITDELKEKKIDYKLNKIKNEGFFLSLIPTLILLAAIFIFYSFFFKKQMGGFSKEKIEVSPDKRASVTFENVAGLKEEKEELEEIVDFLKTPEKYQKLGAKIPKGVLLIGPPGTGKTLLAKAIAGEADVPFYQVSGSEFEEMFVGLGASRVRNLFKTAKENSPCIVFIDEIDAVAKRRSNTGRGSDETAQTLNQILVEMDGFEESENVIVIAATNREDILDPAVVRPGRFDRKVFVGNPDIGEREEILKIHAKNKLLEEDVNLKDIASTTVGFAGADLENLMNEAAIMATKSGKDKISQADINRAFIKTGVGTEKNSKIVSEKDRRITAYHESGHAVLFHLLENVGPVHMISIVPTGNAGGFTIPLPEKDEMFRSKQALKEEIIATFGGRAAEDLIFGDITTGASQDIEQAYNLAYAMVTKFGMSQLGPINIKENTSEALRQRIDAEVSEIMIHSEERAKEILSKNKDLLDLCAETLLEKEKISREEFERLVNA